MKIQGKGSIFFQALLFAAFIGGAVFSAAAQGGDVKPDPAVLPFIDGEVLTYEGKISKIIQGIEVADLIFTVDENKDTGDHLFKAEARSKGTLIKIFGYSFQQEIESTVDNENFRALKTVKYERERERVRNSEARFDYGEQKVTYVETDPNDLTRPPRTIASSIESRVQDLVSGLYRLRLESLTVGSEFEITVSDSGLVYKIPIKVAARERQRSIFGRVWCYRLEPQIFGEGRMIERDGEMSIWIMDDERRVPIRAKVNAPIGKFDIKLEVKLKSAKNLRKI